MVAARVRRPCARPSSGSSRRRPDSPQKNSPHSARPRHPRLRATPHLLHRHLERRSPLVGPHRGTKARPGRPGTVEHPAHRRFRPRHPPSAPHLLRPHAPGPKRVLDGVRVLVDSRAPAKDRPFPKGSGPQRGRLPGQSGDLVPAPFGHQFRRGQPTSTHTAHVRQGKVLRGALNGDTAGGTEPKPRRRRERGSWSAPGPHPTWPGR